MVRLALLPITSIFVSTLLFASFGHCQQEAEQVENTVSEIEDSLFLPQNIFDLEFASNPQVSADGSRIIYQRNYFDIMTDRAKSDIWMIDENDRHVPLLTGGSFQSATWSPDSSRIAYVSFEKERLQVFNYLVQENRSAPISRLTERPGSLTWSPDGKQIAFFMRVPGSDKPFISMPEKPKDAEWADAPKMITKLRYRSDGGGYTQPGYSQLFVLSADGGTPRQITTGEFNHGGNICWLPDSNAVIISGNRHEDHEFQPNNSELYWVDLNDRSIKQLTDRLGPDSSPAISKDGKHLAYTGFDDKFLGNQCNTLYLMNFESGQSSPLLEFDRSVNSPVWSEHHQGFLFTFVDQGNVKLALANLSGSISTITGDLGSNAAGRPYANAGRVSVSENGVIGFCVTTTELPGELARSKPGAAVEVLTRLNEDLLGHKTLGKVKVLNCKSSHDGIDIQSWVMTPPDFDPAKKYPLILEIHGGPFAAYGNVFSAELQLMASAGYVVLYVNPRGSTSYGEDFANLIHHKYPGNDYDDLMSAVDAVIAEGYVDEEKLFVTGGSGGGVLTAWIVGKTNRFKAAVVAKPVINWFSFALTADAYNVYYKYWFPGFPWDHAEHYMERSPISLVGNVETPTMLLTGESDYRTPIGESEQFYQALKLRDVESAMVRIPGASHGIASRPSHLIAKVAYILKWFETHQ